jgi:hypothetical protein
MANVKVYRVKRYNIETDEEVILPRMATREGAAKMGAVIEDTDVEIDEAELEPGEQWTPQDFTP